jgi:Fe-S-cluster containining protein
MQEMTSKDQSLKEFKDHRISQLREYLEFAGRISVEEVAAQIREIGFECIKCGECCIGDDNSVTVFPFEIRRIMAATGEGWRGTVQPPAEGEWDSQGNFHTLEWRIKKENCSCKFYSHGGCKIYNARPFICSTYPFYLDNGILRYSECQGLGKEIEPSEAEKIASLVKERSIVEIKETIALLEKFEDFDRGKAMTKVTCIIVYDSEGKQIFNP